MIDHSSADLQEDSKQLAQILKQNKNGDDIFTKRNLELVT